MYFIFTDEEGRPPPDNEDDMIEEEFGESGKIGAKKLRKLQEKAEKKRQREVKNLPCHGK